MMIPYPYMEWIGLILATPVQFWLGKNFYSGMWSALRNRTFNMDSLIAIGTTTAYIYSIINLFCNWDRPILRLRPCLSLLSFWVSGLRLGPKGQASQAIQKLMQLQPTIETSVGQIILVKPGEKIPADGIVVSGKSYIDESLLTGEECSCQRCR